MLVPALAAATLVVDADTTTRTTYPARSFGALPQLMVDANSRAFVRFSRATVPPNLGSQLMKATLPFSLNRVAMPGVVQVSEVTGARVEGTLTEATAPPSGTPVPVQVQSAQQWVSVDATATVFNRLSGAPNNALVIGSQGASLLIDPRESTTTNQPARLGLTFAGLKRDPGPQGIQGILGIQRIQGVQGPRGSQGLQGPSGPGSSIKVGVVNANGTVQVADGAASVTRLRAGVYRWSHPPLAFPAVPVAITQPIGDVHVVSTTSGLVNGDWQVSLNFRRDVICHYLLVSAR